MTHREAPQAEDPWQHFREVQNAMDRLLARSATTRRSTQRAHHQLSPAATEECDPG
ncbi:hypothetical protein [Streptomyces sp. cmx-4-9]|uniref:hypothetical protein n=1 Tax=Streptomyces sp. cmx-4-9 TaxID=2790941 RepID=UPI00398092B5